MNKDDVREWDTMRRVQDGIDRAVAAERKRILARLENPDEALVDAVMRNTNPVRYPGEIRTIIRALAITLTEGQESSDGA